MRPALLIALSCAIAHVARCSIIDELPDVDEDDDADDDDFEDGLAGDTMGRGMMEGMAHMDLYGQDDDDEGDALLDHGSAELLGMLFQRLDADGDGVLSEAELKSGLEEQDASYRTHSREAELAEAHRVHAEADADGDGRLSLSEFETAEPLYFDHADLVPRAELFAFADSSGDGLSADDLHGLMFSEGSERRPALMALIASAIVSSHDTDGDGALTEEELLAYEYETGDGDGDFFEGGGLESHFVSALGSESQEEMARDDILERFHAFANADGKLGVRELTELLVQKPAYFYPEHPPSTGRLAALREGGRAEADDVDGVNLPALLTWGEDFFDAFSHTIRVIAEDGVPGLGPGGGDALRVGEAEAERAASSAPLTGADSGASDAVADEPAPAQPADATKPEGEAGRDPDGGGRRDADGPAESPSEAASSDEL